MLASLTIAEASEKLRRKEISALELTKSCIERINDVDRALNAVVYKNFDSALDAAKKIDSRGTFDHALAGIPYLAKDVYCEANVPTTGCSNVLQNPTYRPPYDSTTTQLLRTANAISLGKTNTDEFTMGASTETSCYGPTRNPWDRARVAGGSSGGSAAAVAADACLFALGTDTGGSIRQPAAFCGCTGIRPTYGRTSRFGVMSMSSSLDTIGPICKCIEDLAIVLTTIAGRDPLDATTGDVPVPDYRAELKQSIAGLRVGLPKEYFIDGMNAEIEESVREAAKVLEDLGAELLEISLPHTALATPAYYVLCPCEVSSNMARYDGIRYGLTVQQPRDLLDYYERVRSTGFGPEVKRRIMIGTFALSAGYRDAYYRQAQKVRTLIRRDFSEAFKQVEVIIAPVTPTPAFPVGAHEGDPLAMYLEDIFLDPQVMAGIPALAVPCGFARAKSPSVPSFEVPTNEDAALPLGLQIMGPQWGESIVLRTAYAYEQATEWHKRKPSL